MINRNLLLHCLKMRINIVVETSRIQEKYYVVNQTVHVLWGMGKSATPFRAKLILCGHCLMHIKKLISVERSGFLNGVQGVV